MSVIPSSIAKEELVKINEFLTEPHVLIGGLAVQQYYPARNSSDIDLICDDQTAKGIIKKLYPTKDFEITETNEDDFRPAYVISSKVRAEKVIFIGPKITERDAYKFINWERLKKGSIAFSYQKKNLENIRVPQPELLAFTKLLSFLNRAASSRRKGENDLLDFINLSNGKSFSINALIDLIRSSSCEGFISTKLDELSGSYSVDIWNQSLFCDFLKLIKPALEGSTSVPAEVIFSDNYKKTYILEDSLEFYQEIAPLYDERNTEFLYDGHQSVIGFIVSPWVG